MDKKKNLMSTAKQWIVKQIKRDTRKTVKLQRNRKTDINVLRIILNGYCLM